MISYAFICVSVSFPGIMILFRVMKQRVLWSLWMSSMDEPSIDIFGVLGLPRLLLNKCNFLFFFFIHSFFFSTDNNNDIPNFSFFLLANCHVRMGLEIRTFTMPFSEYFKGHHNVNLYSLFFTLHQPQLLWQKASSSYITCDSSQKTFSSIYPYILELGITSHLILRKCPGFFMLEI